MSTKNRVLLVVACLSFAYGIHLFIQYRRYETRYREYRASYSEGEKWIDQGQYKAAIVSLKKAVQIHPDRAPAHDLLGDAFRGAKMREEAIQEYRNAIRLSSGYPATYLHLGNMLEETGHIQEARQAWLKAVEKDGTGPWGQDAQVKLKQSSSK